MAKESDSTNKVEELEKKLAKLMKENTELKSQIKQVQSNLELTLQSKQDAIADNMRLREKVAKVEEDKIFLARTQKITKIARLMQEKGLIESTNESMQEQIKELARMDDQALESWKRLILNAPARTVKTEDDVPSSKKSFANNNHTFFIPDDDEKTMNKISPMSNSSVFNDLPWTTGIKRDLT